HVLLSERRKETYTRSTTLGLTNTTLSAMRLLQLAYRWLISANTLLTQARRRTTMFPQLFSMSGFAIVYLTYICCILVARQSRSRICGGVAGVRGAAETPDWCGPGFRLRLQPRPLRRFNGGKMLFDC